MIILLLTGVALIAGCVALLGHAVALPRLRAMERLGQIDAYGFASGAESPRSQRALAGAFDGLARMLGTFFASRVSEAEIRKHLMAAGLYRMTPVTLVGYRVICTASFPATTVWLGSSAGMGGAMVVMLAVVMGGFGWVAPMTVVQRHARTRLERIDRELPELVDLLVVTVEAGMGFASSMQVAAERSQGPLSDELRLALQEQAMGLPTDQALANMLARADTPSMRSFVRSVRQGESLGVSIGQIMRNLALEMRKRRRADAEERAQKAPIKILFPLVGLIFPALFVVLLAPALLSFTAAFGGGS